MCAECQKLKKRLPQEYAINRPPIVSVKNGKLMCNPEVPQNSDHFCQPIRIEEADI